MSEKEIELADSGWYVRKERNGWAVFDGGGNWISTCPTLTRALLIAAAPELLEAVALHEAIINDDTEMSHDEWVALRTRARELIPAVLRKAHGEIADDRETQNLSGLPGE